jgi:hypothetical protein
MAAGPDGFGREQNVDRTDNTLLIGDFWGRIRGIRTSCIVAPSTAGLEGSAVWMDTIVQDGLEERRFSAPIIDLVTRWRRMVSFTSRPL